jgi:signal transduction histidine kinase
MTFKTKLAAGIGTALAVLAFLGVLSYGSILRSRRDIQWVTHTHLVLEKIDGVMAAVTDAETGQRGFIITLDESYLQLYNDAFERAQQGQNELRTLTSDNPVQQRNLDRLAPVINARLAEMRDRIEIRKKDGLEAAVKAIQEGSGKKSMDRIRGVIADMVREERRLLALRTAEAASSARWTESMILLGNAFGFLFLLLAGVVIYQEMAHRRRAEEEVRELNADLENRVAKRTADLEAANKELEAFSYSVSHDLRPPLRHIDGFSSMLLEASGRQLDADSENYLRRICAATRHMAKLIDDLVKLVQVGRQAMNLRPMRLSALVKQVVEESGPEIQGRQIEWRIGALPSEICDEGLIKQVFANLIGNSIKYSKLRETAVIEVGQAVIGGTPAVFVRDNGTGFNMKYADKLFGAFQRLDHETEFEGTGTGMGLATARRIVQRHGGRIWAEAEPDKGATFYFTLNHATESAFASRR